MAEGNDLEVELKIRNYLTALHVENVDLGIRRVVEARRRATGSERTAEQEQGKQARFAGSGTSDDWRKRGEHKRSMSGGRKRSVRMRTRTSEYPSGHVGLGRRRRGRGVRWADCQDEEGKEEEEQMREEKRERGRRRERNRAREDDK